MQAGICTHIEGSVTAPVKHPSEWIIVSHVVNDAGKWGAGVSGAIGTRWPLAEQRFRESGFGFQLGDVQIFEAEPKIIIANMFAQHGVRYPGEEIPIPLRYGSLARCMEIVAEEAVRHGCNIHCPKFGSGLAGGNWALIELMIHEIWCRNGINVAIYQPGATP